MRAQIISFISLIALPICAFSNSLTASGPIVINGESDVVISGLHISNPNGACVMIGSGASNIIIKNSEIGPCDGNAVDIRSSNNITVQSNYIHDAVGEGVYLHNVELIEVTNNKIERVRTGVYASIGSQIKVSHNEFRNMQGPMPRGQMVQLAFVKGPGNSVTNNFGINELGFSVPEDAINMYKSKGVPGDPIMISNNLIIGGGPSTSGGGILLGDGGESSYQVAKDNILVNPGQYGVAIAGGHHHKLLNNLIYSKQFSFTNIGIYVWDQYDSACTNITVRGNSVNYTHRDGFKNAGWNGLNCGVIDGWSSDNNWNASIEEDVAEQHPGLINTNIAVVSVTASSFDSPLHTPQNTIDNDLTSRWSAEGNQWIRYDLGGVFIVSQLDIAFWLGNARSYAFDIELSVDGTNWKQVFNGQSGGSTTGLESFDFTAALARFVRINGRGNTASHWNNYLEVDIIASTPAYYQEGLIFRNSFE
ncbi:MAG: right-handed parallel beta-helix repeat-containing protein [Xanthomonadales bacterium]|nr:right-handed parallel beta-helix repeat-containing protein [Xanthomonadales bacterium]